MNKKTEDNRQVQNIISELLSRNVIPAEPSSCKKLSGGTVSELYLLNVEDTKYVLKLNDPSVTGPEALFLNTYKRVGFLPELLYADPSENYILYSFMDGSTSHKGINKKEILKKLAEELINRYEIVGAEAGWGWVDSPATSWQDFLTSEIAGAHKVIGSAMDERDQQLMNGLAERVGANSQPFLLHGDCGFHNFIFADKTLVGVIDPAPVIGDPIYDLVYAFCSSPDDLTKETFDHATRHLKIREAKDIHFLYENLLVGLYLRIALSKKHHPADLPSYLKAWTQWLEVTGSPKN